MIKQKTAIRKSPKRKPKNASADQAIRKADFVQNYIPIKEIRNGIVETTDNRYIKIVEIDPINFVLRSSEEQFNIISSFASWLKISPMKLQFKSLTRKADAEKHINMVMERLKEEKNPQCRELGQEYINLIREVGSKEALTRRFFLIFEYEQLPGRRNDDYADIYSMIQTAVQNVKTYLSQCGNTLVQPKDEDAWTTEVLYMFYNRRSCVDEPFGDRVDRVIMDTMTARGKVIGVDPVPRIKMNNFIAPRGIDLNHHNYIIMDGMYYSFMFIRGDGYPHAVRGGWLSSLVNAGEGIDCDVFLKREIRGRTLDKVAQRIRLNKSKLKNMQDTNTDFEELANSIQAGYYIKQGISNNNEDLFYMSIFITVTGNTYEELLWRKSQMTDLMKSMDMHINECAFQQEVALKTIMPLIAMDKNLEKKSRRNVLTSGAASTYMFTSFEMSDDNGVLLGLNRHNNSLCIADYFNTKVYKNANITLLGATGAGKTYTLATLMLRMRMCGIPCYVVAPLKGHEFRRACQAVGGTFVKIAPGSGDCINVMEIRKTTAPEMSLLDEIDYNAEASLLSNKIQQLITFFFLLIPDMTNEEEQMLDEALVKTYAEFGIAHDNDSLYTDAEQTRFRPMPILGDLHKNLKENPLTQRITTILSRFVTGSAQSFNQQTNVDLDNDFVVMDISELKGRLLPCGMFIAIDCLWDAIKADRTKRKMLGIDEIWQLIGATSNRKAAEFCLEIFKIIRAYGGGALASSQDLSDFFGLDDGKYGRAILNACRTKIVLNLEPDEAAYVQKALNLTKNEVRSIIQFERGEALISANNNKIPVKIKASRAEHRLITTDRAELEQMIKERQATQKRATGHTS